MFERLFVPAELVEATSDAAWLAAMLEAERALAVASARAELISVDAAEAIAAACRPERFDAERLAVEGGAAGNPAEPLVRALRDEVGGDAAASVHRGATSQDIVDTAAMLVTRNALDSILVALDGVAAECAQLAETHRSTPMVGRTLLQHGVPTTFGLQAAGWLVAVRAGRAGLARVRDERLAVQLGGAAGTLAAFGGSGLEVRRLFAEELGLAEPLLAWHTDRGRIAELAGALGATAAALAKIAVDVALLAQTEVAEVTDTEAGGSSTMPQKRNPVGSALAVACARQVHGYATVLIAPGGHEHERGLGGWHSEWHALSGALAYTGGAADALRRTLAGLEVHPERMLENLRASGVAASERVSLALSERLGRRAAHELVAEAAGRGASLADALAADDRVELSRDDLEAALDPLTYLGQAEALVDAALR